MMLDINTEAGQISLTQERDLIAAIERETDYRIIQTPKIEPSDIDGFLCLNGEICGIIENKCREATLMQLKGNWCNEWLITFEKITKGATLARALKVPFFGFLYLIPDGVALSIRLSDKHGNLLPNIRLGRTETRETINGGAIVRTNAYVDMSNAKQIIVKT